MFEKVQTFAKHPFAQIIYKNPVILVWWPRPNAYCVFKYDFNWSIIYIDPFILDFTVQNRGFISTHQWSYIGCNLIFHLWISKIDLYSSITSYKDSSHPINRLYLPNNYCVSSLSSFIPAVLIKEHNGFQSADFVQTKIENLKTNWNRKNNRKNQLTLKISFILYFWGFGFSKKSAHFSSIILGKNEL